MNRQDKSILYAKRQAERWEQNNKIKARNGEPEYSVEQIIKSTWLDGFDAGQMHQRKIAKAKKEQKP